MICLLLANFILISDRASFWDPDKESIKTEQLKGQQTEECSVDFHQFKRKKVLLLVHGFNNTAQDAISTYRQINDQVATLLDASGNLLYDIVIGYLWPGCDSRLDYFSAEKNAVKLAPRLHSHLNALAFFSKKIDVLAHSMGNRLVLEALDSLSAHQTTDWSGATPKQYNLNNLSEAWKSQIQWLHEAGKNYLHNHVAYKLHQTKPIQNFYSFGAAVSDESIEKQHKYYNSTQQCQNMYVFHSSRDDVLKFLFLIAERNEALGFKGKGDLRLTSKNIQFIDCTSFVDGHSGYFLAAPLYKFIQNQHANQTLASDIAPNVKLLADGLIAPIAEE